MLAQVPGTCSCLGSSLQRAPQAPQLPPPKGTPATDLVIDFPLQLHHLVLHAHVEAFQVLCGAGLYLEGLQLLLGLEHPEGTLDDDGRAPQLLKAPACHPAPQMLLEDGGLVLHEDLERLGGQAHTCWVCMAARGEAYVLPGGRAKAGLGFRRYRENMPP